MHSEAAYLKGQAISGILLLLLHGFGEEVGFGAEELLLGLGAALALSGLAGLGLRGAVGGVGAARGSRRADRHWAFLGEERLPSRRILR